MFPPYHSFILFLLIGRRDSRVPELLHSDFFVGYSCLSRQTSYDKGGGLYFKLLIDVYKDGLKYPTRDHGKEYMNFIYIFYLDRKFKCHQ